MKVALRNRLAEWMLDALVGPSGEEPLRALARFLREADEGGRAPRLPAVDVSPLSTLLDPAAETPRLRADFVAELPALRDRAGRFERAIAATRARCGARPPGDRFAPNSLALAWTLCAAGCLLDSELFFEVHELLEPPWRDAAEPLRTFLQGLLQVAVGFHHRENGNTRGAVALLRDGGGRLAVFRPRAFGLELDDFCRSVSSIAAALAADPTSAAAGARAPRVVLRPITQG